MIFRCAMTFVLAVSLATARGEDGLGFSSGSLPSGAASDGGTDGGRSALSLPGLEPGDRLEIVTEARFYRATVVDPVTGETVAEVSGDGLRFSSPAKVFLLGCTAGRQDHLMLVSMGELRVGQRIELGRGSLEAKDRALTEPVQSLRLHRARNVVPR